jgi:hypothetical protein
MTADEFFELVKIFTLIFGILTILLVFVNMAYEKTKS